MEALKNSPISWENDFVGVEQQELILMSLSQLIIIRHMHVYPAFLDACLEYWNPVHHVFAFPDGEIFPLPEEFAPLGGWRVEMTPVIPEILRGYKRKFMSDLGLSRAEADEMIVDGGVDLLAIAWKFQGKSGIHVNSAHRHRAFGFCMLHYYLFEGRIEATSGIGEVQLLTGVEEMEGGRSPTWLVLAETIIGLDARNANPEAWSMLDPPVKPDVYKPTSLTSRKKLFHDGHYHNRPYWDGHLTFDGRHLIRWFVPWWHLTTLTGLADQDEHRSLLLLGLENTVHPYPDRVLRQFGRQQTILERDARLGASMILTQAMCETWLTRWPERVVWPVPEQRQTTWVSRYFE
ncbi:hypothetical protein RND81_04G039300 [Saponaria officinalis]|uniref:Aminotransferase-like plant mobile domain-containing protein n=1 Tax=Saponaria officinalis TaxID=3572 RepID=A0AAW1LER8_SAPOF